MSDERELEMQRAALELRQFEGYVKKPENLFFGRCQEMDTKDTEMRADEDPGNEPQSKWQKASRKGTATQETRPAEPGTGQLLPEEAASAPGGRRRRRENPGRSKRLTKLVLRQADTLAYLELDMGFMVFLKTSMRPRLPTEEETTEVKQWAIVTDLFKAAEQWHARKSEDPTSLNATLWATLMHCMITALLVRVESLVGNDTGLRSSRAAGACRRRQAQLTYIAMERLSFNAVWHLVGATVRPSKLGRGPLER
eukprot:s8110_g2.t1